MADSTTLTAVAVAGVVLGAVGLIIAIIALVSTTRMRRSLVLLEAHEGRDTILDVMARTVDDVSRMRREVGALDNELVQTQQRLAMALRHVSVVRYDAFDDMSGRFSFSAAMLDDLGDGLVITAIYSRSETRTYLKGLTSGVADVDLSPEEIQAVKLARGGQE